MKISMQYDIDGSRLTRALLLVTAVTLAAPFILADLVPFVDVPNHIARFATIQRYSSDPWLQSVLTPDWGPIPNLGLDVVTALLGRVVSVTTATRTVFAAAAFGFVLLLAALARQLHGRSSLLAVVAGFLFFNSNLSFGFINYAVGTTLFLATFLVWLRARAAHGALLWVGVCGLSIATSCWPTGRLGSCAVATAQRTRPSRTGAGRC
jgi:hypothetical protein